MKKSKVVLLQCSSYDQVLIKKEVVWGLEQLGGLGQFYSPEEKILLKPNLLRRATAESAIVTHPNVVSTVAEIFQEAGYSHLSYGDSAGVGSLEKVADVCGLAEAMKALKIPMANFGESVWVDYPEGKMAKQFPLAKGVTESDGLVNLCKMKTHQLERMTGAVKNMYGCVQGLHKAKGHTKYSDAESFARMLADLNRCLRPRLHIMDGIRAMEGNGPASGTPVDMGVLLLSEDPVALDSVCCYLMALNPEIVPTNAQGQRMGLGVWQADQIEVITRMGILSPLEAGKNYGKPDFDVNRGKELRRLWRQIRWVSRLFQRKPYIVEERCIRCGICVEACPVEGKALVLNKPAAPIYDYKKCIRCFCCQEMCPEKAIRVK